MGTSLPRYLEMKMYQALRERCYDRIVVTGEYARTAPLEEVFQGEKTDKDFNWQRPTTLLVGKELHIRCFPGNDHVEHYAELIATFLEIQHRNGHRSLTLPSNVVYIPPSCSDTQKALHATNLKDLPPHVDTVVLGLVHRLDRLTGGAEWQGGSDGCFGWVVRKFNDRLVAFVGCRPSFWGDIASEIVHYLAASKRISEVLYFGKLGSVKKGIRPNNYLATGSSSYVSGQLVMWQNALEPSVNLVAPEHTIFGTHITLGSVLHETRDWLGELPASVDFVDPEIGMIA
ncbi:hypothetical protein BLS_002174 [Venturia inaequalis]|uniref:Uncharacterized protein n=1 Tax=Venturia inaequalis TaxID=5025 RepID=A0A8H3U1C5_VENIN|nr:hypothetical protein BLS_002174 [Venturia inaequalis]